MFDYISGGVAELTPTYVVIDVGGLGFKLNISLYTYSALQGSKEGKVYVYESIREDAHLLYGFISQKERELFELLVSVSGVGAGSARMIQSTLKPSELTTVIATGNAAMLKTVKGIGAKTAQRIIVDLKDKINSVESTLTNVVTPSGNEVYEEALAALVTLGFPQPISQRALKKIFAEEPDIKVEVAIKKALNLCK